tara:strand:- start:93 stop:1031 length:939 start_codon:yes stop_codon:yes gene_type:complete
MADLKDYKINIKAPAKINLHLELIGKRSDGYHELAMIMQSINLFDYLELENNNNGELKLTTDSKELGLTKDNLIIKTANLLREFTNKRKFGANIFLKKNIPIGAGLAGGSSDAAATLVGLNKLWDLNLNSKIIHELASEIGSDVPFCINGGTQYCFGRGEILQKLEFNNNFSLILIKNPEVSISTADIYKKYSKKYDKYLQLSSTKIKERRENLTLMEFGNKIFLKNKITIRNDLQKIVQKESKSVNDALNLLSELENILSFSMSGSGPSCFAIFQDKDKAKVTYDKNIEKFKKYGFDVWICDFCNEGIKFI